MTKANFKLSSVKAVLFNMIVLDELTKLTTVVSGSNEDEELFSKVYIRTEQNE